MNAVRKMILKRFLNRNMCFLRHAKSEFRLPNVDNMLELVTHVPNPEWWMLDEAKYNKLKLLLSGVYSVPGVLEIGFTSKETKVAFDKVNQLLLTPLCTPGVYFHNVLGDSVPLHVVRFQHEGQDWLFLPLHRPAVEKETIS